jgi:hypothetical protein
MKKYTFDVKMFATIRVKAETQKEARAKINAELEGADANFGAWPCGKPIEASISLDGDHDLIEIDGEAV